MDIQEFTRTMTAAGFDQVLERVWQPGTRVPDHSHPFHARALMVAGELWLTVDGQTRHLRAGDTFDLPPGSPHAERYGPEGATFWVARRNPPA